MSGTPLWSPERPHTLVVACSDGRLQEATDHFLGSLGVTEYDRLYLPGGPGALAGNWREMVRAARHMQELTFLLEVHDVQRVFLLFHGSAEGGPADAECADYARAMPGAGRTQVMETQLSDAAEVIRRGLACHPVEVLVYRAEVLPDRHVQFLRLDALVKPLH